MLLIKRVVISELDVGTKAGPSCWLGSQDVLPVLNLPYDKTDQLHYLL